MRGGHLVRWSVRLLCNALCRGWFFGPRGREWLIIPSKRRKMNSQGIYEAIHTDEFASLIPEHRRLILDPPYHWEHYKRTMHVSRYEETSMVVSFLLRPIVGLRIASKLRSVRRMAGDVELYLEKTYGRTIRVANDFLSYAVSFARTEAAVGVMLQWLRPRRILLVCSYGREPLIVAARRLLIPTIEVQHGVVTPEHLGYSFSKGMTKRSFPDYVLLFGNYWKRNVVWPISPDRLIVMGFPHFEKQVHNLRDVSEKQNRATVISQGTSGPFLSRFAVDLARGINRPDKIYYKLHPGEVARWRQTYPWLESAVQDGILEVIEGHEPDLYTLLAESKWQIGVNSTALFEGLALGCRTILVVAPGIEYMENLIDSGVCQLVRIPDEIDWEMPLNENFNTSDFFYPNWRRQWEHFCSRALVSRRE